LTLQEIAEATRIPPHHLEALEAGQMASLPAVVYIRGFIRAYARALEMDEEDLIGEFNALTSTRQRADSQEQSEEYNNLPTQKANRLKEVISSTKPSRKKFGLSFFLGGAVLILALLAGLWYYFYVEDSVVEPGLPRPIQLTGPEVERPGPVENVENGTVPRDGEPAGVQISEPGQPVEEGKSEVPPGTGMTGTTPEPAAPGIESAPSLPAGREGVKTLELVALEKTWIRVNRDGVDMGEYLLHGGMSVSLTAEKGFTLLIGNAGGVRITYNGEVLPTPGKRGEVKTLILPEP